MGKWVTKKISEFTFTSSGGTPSTNVKEYWENGTIPWINSGELSQNDFISSATTYISESALKNSSAKLMPIDTVVIALTGATTGMSALLKIETSGNQSITGIYPSQNHDSLFLLYYLQHNIRTIIGFNIGSAQPHINKGIVDNLDVNMPENVNEQNRISHIIRTIHKSIEETEALIAKYQRIKTGLMQDLLTRGIDEKGNIRSRDTHKFVVKNGIEVPKEWDVDCLENICSKISDGAHQGVKFDGSNDIPFLFVSCIKPYQILWENCSYISHDNYLIVSKGKEPHRGMVLYSVVGSYGNAVTVDTDTVFTFQRHIAFIIPNENRLIPEYLTLFLNSEMGRRMADDLATGNAQKTITLNALRGFMISLPKPPEQRSIVSKLSFVTNLIRGTQNELKKLQSLKAGLMQDLLSGRVRVKIKEEVEA